MQESYELINIKPFEDIRGILKKPLCKSMIQPEQEIQEVYVLFSNKDAIRGNHYHKKTTEYFMIIEGQVKMAFANIDGSNFEEIEVKASDNILIKVNTEIVHAMKNEAEDTLIILAISLKEYKKDDTDTFVCNIL